MRMHSEERYQNDPSFRNIVDTIRAFLANTPDITPTELREAVALAASLHEMEHIRPLIMDRHGTIKYAATT